MLAPPQQRAIVVRAVVSCDSVWLPVVSGRISPVLEIHIEETDTYTLCRPSGELDAYTVGTFREALSRLAGQNQVLIDLSEVPFMDSAGLGALIGGIRRAREADGAVAVACSRPALTRLLHTTGFDRIVPVTGSIEDAEEALAEEAGQKNDDS